MFILVIFSIIVIAVVLVTFCGLFQFILTIFSKYFAVGFILISLARSRDPIPMFLSYYYFILYLNFDFFLEIFSAILFIFPTILLHDYFIQWPLQSCHTSYFTTIATHYFIFSIFTTTTITIILIRIFKINSTHLEVFANFHFRSFLLIKYYSLHFQYYFHLVFSSVDSLNHHLRRL